MPRFEGGHDGNDQGVRAREIVLGQLEEYIMTETTTDYGWLDNETWEPEQVAEMVRRYRAHADLLAALEAARDTLGRITIDEGSVTSLIETAMEAREAVMGAIARARGIGQNIDTKA